MREKPRQKNGIIKRAAKLILDFVVFFTLLVLVNLGGALVTAHIAGDNRNFKTKHVSSEQSYDVFLLTGVLHTDIAVPFSAELLERFSFLQDSALPLDNPNLKYLSFGWGSEAFYTTAGTYADIRINAVLKAVLGDRSVLRVVGLGKLDASDDIRSVKFTHEQYVHLLSYIEDSFVGNAEKQKHHLPGVYLQSGDAFYKAKRRFNILYPCNQWVNQAMRESGVRLGIWTPTAQSLKMSLDHFSAGRSQP